MNGRMAMAGLLAAIVGAGAAACGDAKDTGATSGSESGGGGDGAGGSSSGSGGKGGSAGQGGDVGGGGSGGAGGIGGVAKAENDFWSAFHGQHYDKIPDVTAELDAAYGDAKDAEDTLLDAHARLWRLAEWGRDPSQDPSEIPGIALAADQRFQEAQMLAPGDARIAGWLGPLEMTIGQATGDANRVAKGQMIIDQGVAAYPEFNLFVRGLVTMSLDASDPSYAAGIDAFWQNLDACYDAPVDRASFDVSDYLDHATTTGTKRVCWNGDMIPHNVEGFFLYMGDAFVKVGDVDTATLAWSQAQKMPSYDTWPFRAQLEDRLAHASDWAALLTDDDASNDPVLINASATPCAACHASK